MDADKPETKPATDDGGSLWARLRQHKVLQWALAYVGAALAIGQGVELLAAAYDWPRLVGRVVMTLLVLGFPLVLTLAWYHGHRGLKRIGTGELTIIALLLVMIGGGFTVLVHEPDRGTALREAVAAPAGAQRASIDQSAAPATADAASLRGPASGKPRLAVLPFKNLSPDPANAFFADGMHEEILSTLASRAPGLEVISSTTMMSYRGRAVSVPELAQALHCTHVLEGSVRREGNEVRLTLQLIDASTDQHVWAEDFDRKLTNAMTLQSEVAGQVAQRLSSRFAGESSSVAARPTANPAAYDLYLKALAAAQTEPGLTELALNTRRVELLDAAVALDPAFGAAYLARANAALEVLRVQPALPSNREPMDRIARDIDAARARLGDTPAVWSARALLTLAENLGTPERALDVLRQGEATAGSDAGFLETKVFLLSISSRVREAIELLPRAVALDPGNRRLLRTYGVALGAARRPAEALRILSLVEAGFDDDLSRRAAIQKARLRLAYTGDPVPLRAVLDRLGARIPADIRLSLQYELLRYERRYRDLAKLLRESGELRMQRSLTLTVDIGGGSRAIAGPQGYTYLLAGDRAAAAEIGQAILRRLDNPGAPPPGFSELAWRGVIAFGQGMANNFLGRREPAAAGARDMLAAPKLSQATIASCDLLTAGDAATVLAWAGAGDEAIAVLEGLYTCEPGLAPAEITRDPLFSVPLAGNARYKALSARLEAQMKANPLN